jgi:4-amino-4-deoxy-L-arabinose transferase-like glycosyltransferase
VGEILDRRSSGRHPETPSGQKQGTQLEVTYRWARRAVTILFLLLCLLSISYNGPFFDEGIYVTAGLRTLERAQYRDGFLTWFAGSLAWPVLAGIGYQIGGLMGTRVVAVLLGTLTLLAFSRATRNLFDEKVGFWATLAFALNGPFIALARLGVYDILALTGIAFAFWGITELQRQDHRVWLILTVLTYVLAIFAKYPIGLMVIPLLGTLYFVRRQKANTDIMIFLFTAGALGLTFFLPAREQIGSFFNWRLQNRPEFGVPLSVIGFALLYLNAAPFLLAVWGWLRAAGRRDWGVLALLSLGIWPTYHLLTGDPVGPNKHVVFGFLFVYPLIGVALSNLWDSEKRSELRKAATIVLVIGLAGLGLLQVNQADHGWPDLRPPAGVLLSLVEPGDQLLINESWPFTMYLYAADRIDSPWDVYDTYRITHEEETPDLCDYDWIVDVRGSYRWPQEIQEKLEQCETYQPIYDHTSLVINLGEDFNYVRYPINTVIWENVKE